MTTSSVVTAGMNAVMTALTPMERWYALRRLERSFVADRWFILTGVGAIIVLTVLLVVVTWHRAARQRRVSGKLFLAYAGKAGLTRRECQILQDIATRAKLRRNESIFTMGTAFERGAARIAEETLTVHGPRMGKHLNAELSVLREKLGFEGRRPVSAGSAVGPNRPSSRQIPTGKKLYITAPHGTALAGVESTVIKNDDIELAVRLAAPLEGGPGELCGVRYNFGASVWEFDAAVVSCHGGILVLSHSDDVRFINRRRFVRVPVKGAAFIARFPFTRTLPSENDFSEDAQQGPAPVSGDAWGPPEFVPAQVTELAGPGLRVKAPLEVKVGERVVVILKISEEAKHNSTARRNAISPRSRELQSSRTKPSRIVEDIGEVRHAEATQDGFSIAVELTGLSDSNVNELIRATNAASVKAAAASQDVAAFDGGEDYETVEAPEPALVRGI
jgi:hypothetical protein